MSGAQLREVLNGSTVGLLGQWIQRLMVVTMKVRRRFLQMFCPGTTCPDTGRKVGLQDPWCENGVVGQPERASEPSVVRKEDEVFAFGVYEHSVAT